MKHWGFTPQKPIKRAYEQSPEVLKAWIEQQYREIEKCAKAEGGEIHWGDATALVNTDVRGRSYAPKGQTPVTMAVGGTCQKRSMISTVTNQGKASWMIIDGAFNHEKLIEFLTALVADGQRANTKILLILDNLGAHHCKPVKAWLEQRKERIEFFCLPSYSPELNPDEPLNADLKHAIGTKVKLQAAANDHMKFIEANLERVRSYFQDPRVKYAARIQTSLHRINRAWAPGSGVDTHRSGLLSVAGKSTSPQPASPPGQPCPTRTSALADGLQTRASLSSSHRVGPQHRCRG